MYLYIAIPDADESRHLAAADALLAADVPIEHTWTDPRPPTELATGRRSRRVWSWTALMSFLAVLGSLLAWVWTGNTSWAGTALVLVLPALVFGVMAIPTTPKAERPAEQPKEEKRNRGRNNSR